MIKAVKTSIAILALGAALVGVPEAPVEAASNTACTITWTAPQTNADGTNLTDLKEYGVYIGANPAALTVPTAVVPAPSADPAVGATATYDCRALAVGNYVAQIDAADANGNRSVRSAVVPFSVTDGVAPSKPGDPVITP